MRYEISVTDKECREIIAAHLSTLLHFDVPPGELASESYGGGYKLGKYGGYEYPPKPAKPATPKPIDVDDVGPAPVSHCEKTPVSAAEVLTEAKDPPF